MADVYVGRGIGDDGSDELVALKVMRDEYGQDARFLRMFSDEARILERLSHPNIIRTIESGITRDHRYIVMELLAGRTLADVWEAKMKAGKQVPWRLGAWICARVAAGLHAAHELRDAGGEPLAVVHRDVNPSNIFLTYSGEVKLIDFGLAKARVRRTRSVDGIVKGKFPYLAPEQLTSRAVDRKIDLFALGTTLWEVATMRRLFKRDNDIETLRAVRECVIPDPREIAIGYPDRLAAITMYALAPDPAARIASADVMRRELDAFVCDSPSDAMSTELARLLVELFPGEEDRYAHWQQKAISQRYLVTAPPPPMPLAVASSDLLAEGAEVALEDADIEIIPPK
jgi:serine/threonine-protein kinase